MGIIHSELSQQAQNSKQKRFVIFYASEVSHI